MTKLGRLEWEVSEWRAEMALCAQEDVTAARAMRDLGKTGNS